MAIRDIRELSRSRGIRDLTNYSPSSRPRLVASRTIIPTVKAVRAVTAPLPAAPVHEAVPVMDVVNAINHLANFISKLEENSRKSLMDILATQQENNKTIVDALQTTVDKKVALRTMFTITGRDQDGKIAEFVAEDRYDNSIIYPEIPESPEIPQTYPENSQDSEEGETDA
jgi:hypothetical protein